MSHTVSVPKDIAEAIVSPRAHAERDTLFSGLRWLSSNNPVGLVEADGYDPFWLLTRHQDVLEVSRQNSLFHNADRPAIVVNREGEAAMRARTGRPCLVRTLVQMDEPDHLQYRRVIQGWFTAVRLKALEADIRAIARASVDHMASLGGRCDFVRDVGLTYPLRVLMKLIGIPPEDEALMLKLTQEVFGIHDEDLGRNAAGFAGEQIHSASFRSARPYSGRRCVVIGADVSGQNISAALWEAGADATMVQRFPVIIVRRDSFVGTLQDLYSDTAVDRGLTPEKADVLGASLPFRLLLQQHIKVFADIKQRDAAFYRKLEEAGFHLTDGEDHAGLLPQLYRRGAGYYVNVGASELIINGSIKVRSRVQVEAITKHGVLLSDGTELPADVIVYAAGYDRAKLRPWQILPDEVRHVVGAIWGFGSGGRGDPGPWLGEIC